jgi:pyruvate dehydrogenase E2 component (dihydrolipoamide acetyltransferase)
VVSEFLEALAHDRAHLVGHSLGGAVSTALAVARPDQVASLTLIGSAGLGCEINGDYIDGLLSASSRRELKPVLELLFADPSVVTRQLVDNVLRYKRIDGVDDALRRIAGRAFAGGRQTVVLAPRLDELAVPVLVIWGRQDRIIPPEHASAAPPTARVEIIETAGHSPHMESAGDVNRLVDEFVSSAGN